MTTPVEFSIVLPVWLLALFAFLWFVSIALELRSVYRERRERRQGGAS